MRVADTAPKHPRSNRLNRVLRSPHNTMAIATDPTNAMSAVLRTLSRKPKSPSERYVRRLPTTAIVKKTHIASAGLIFPLRISQM